MSAPKTKKVENVRVTNPYPKPDVSGLLDYLSDGLLLEEEKDIARMFGYWISPAVKDSYGNLSFKMVASDGSIVSLTQAQGKILRTTLLHQWYERKTEKVRVVEVDPIRESLEARNGD
jgi:hypothetical protein